MGVNENDMSVFGGAVWLNRDNLDEAGQIRTCRSQDRGLYKNLRKQVAPPPAS